MKFLKLVTQRSEHIVIFLKTYAQQVPLQISGYFLTPLSQKPIYLINWNLI